ncbi:amino acid permease [Syntrophomonas palmitatica]|uniref:amino acid permease n=1 Tax=Syntrophomonas palmitatica TaxID=402877 RepID=UPI0009FAB1C5|nr:amino acid permease [Syntrophomonas palmitatica]
MLFRRQAEQVLHRREQAKSVKGKIMRWWDLALIGTGAVIGAGFFLGTVLSIQRAGPSIVLLYLLGGVCAYFVFAALAAMSINDPQEGSFRVYARKAFGSSMGFVSGWNYWLAGVLIMSSEVAALAIFTRYWFPGIGLWVFAAFYAVIGFTINLLGVKDFGKVESLFGILKTSSLVIFIIFGVLLVFGLIIPDKTTAAGPLVLFPGGLTGSWSAMIFVLFSYGGIEVMGLLCGELKRRREVGRAGRVMVISLTVIYSLALLFALLIVPWQSINISSSPFVTALSSLGLPYADSLLNLLVISAAFSTMVGALFAVTNVLVSLAEDGDAPHALIERNHKGVPLLALSITGLGLAVTVLVSFLLPAGVYEYFTTAAGVMLILNWLLILASHMKNQPVYHKACEKEEYRLPGFPYSTYLAMAIIVLTIIGALLFAAERIGVLISLSAAIVIFLISRLRRSLGQPEINPAPAHKKLPK